MVVGVILLVGVTVLVGVGVVVGVVVGGGVTLPQAVMPEIYDLPPNVVIT